MLTSITPLGERGRGNRWAVTTTAYAVGCLLGGATTGLLLGSIGALLPALPGLVLGGLVLLAAAAADLAPGRLPGGHRQVDEDWLTRYRGWVYGAGFGYQLGLGVVTVVTSAATYAVLALALLTQSAVAGLLVGAVFGAARAVPALTLGRSQSLDQIRRSAAGLERQAPAPARGTAALLAVAGAALLTGAAL
ncbi:MAG: hypothetical protein JWN08_886 [Frankiales bacterium]|nr:hypothetical protein [Frankiales bacterium]